MPKAADRAAEMNRLIVEQATFIQALKGKTHLTAEEMGESHNRAARLIELVELLDIDVRNTPGAEHTLQTAEAYVNWRIAGWLKANPLPLTMQHVHDKLTAHPLYPLEGGVYVSIGDLAKGGYRYRLMADDFAWSGARVVGLCTHDPQHEHNDADCDNQVVRGDMVLRVPESVAEHFRQQGSRKRSREIAKVLGFELPY